MNKKTKVIGDKKFKENEDVQNTNMTLPLNYYVSKFQNNYISKVRNLRFRNAQMRRNTR